MAITTQAQWFAASRQRIWFYKGSNILASSFQSSRAYGTGYNPGLTGSLDIGNITSGAILTPTTAAGFPVLDPWGTNTGYIARIDSNLNCPSNGSTKDNGILYDYVYGIGAIPITANTTITLTGQPSLSGRLDGTNGYEQLEMIAEGVTAYSGSVLPTVSISYTNQAGVSGSITSLSPSLNIGQVSRLPLQSADKGIQSIQSITISGGVGITAGSFNIFLIRRLATFGMASFGNTTLFKNKQMLSWEHLCCPKIFQNSCLAVCSGARITASSSAFGVMVTVING